MAFDYFGNKITASTADGNNLKPHHMNTISQDDFHYLKPGIISRRTLNALHHYTTGRGIFIPTKMCAFMEFAFPKETKFFKQMIMVGANKLDFAQDRTAEIGTKDPGIEGQQQDYISKTSGLTREFTINMVAELDGAFYTFYMAHWLEGCLSIRDGVTNMYGFQGAPTAANMSMEGMYFTMDPTERYVVYSAYITNMLPKNSQMSIFDTTKGEYQHAEIPLQFTGMPIDLDKNVFNAAQAYLDKLNGQRGHAQRLTGHAYHEKNKLEIPTNQPAI